MGSRTQIMKTEDDQEEEGEEEENKQEEHEEKQDDYFSLKTRCFQTKSTFLNDFDVLHDFDNFFFQKLLMVIYKHIVPPQL